MNTKSIPMAQAIEELAAVIDNKENIFTEYSHECGSSVLFELVTISRTFNRYVTLLEQKEGIFHSEQHNYLKRTDK